MSGTNEFLLELALEATVPLIWLEINARGGPNERDWDRAKAAAPILLEHGDDLLYRSKKRGQTAAYFKEFAFALAGMAYTRGGMNLLGKHWCPVPSCKATTICDCYDNQNRVEEKVNPNV